MRNLFITILLIYCSFSGYSQINPTKVGQTAPPIKVENWIYPKIKVENWENNEVPNDLKGKIIVLDFWFIGCAPCVASIPELNYLAKQFPEIVFLSVTFDEPKEIDAFLDKMIMHYPIGSDPEQKIINAFGVSAFPETFLIDENGIIKWQGSPFDLDKGIINRVLGRETKTTNLNLNKSEIPFDNSAYSFTIQKHALQMGQSSYYHFNPYDINVFNRDLEDMLKVIYGINKSRILTKDSTLLNTPYDLNLKADKEITTHANSVEMLKYLLPKQMGFKLLEVAKDTILLILQVENDSLLNTQITSSEGFGTTMRYDNWEAQGATINNLKDFLENNYSELVVVEKTDNRKFNFIISAKDFREALETLKNDYGITLKKKSQKTKLWEIIDKKGN